MVGRLPSLVGPADHRGRGTVGPASRPAAGAVLTLLRLSHLPAAVEANFLHSARDHRPLLRARRIAVYTPFFLTAAAFVVWVALHQLGATYKPPDDFFITWLYDLPDQVRGLELST